MSLLGPPTLEALGGTVRKQSGADAELVQLRAERGLVIERRRVSPLQRLPAQPLDQLECAHQDEGQRSQRDRLDNMAQVQARLERSRVGGDRRQPRQQQRQLSREILLRHLHCLPRTGKDSSLLPGQHCRQPPREGSGARAVRMVAGVAPQRGSAGCRACRFGCARRGRANNSRRTGHGGCGILGYGVTRVRTSSSDPCTSRTQSSDWISGRAPGLGLSEVLWEGHGAGLVVFGVGLGEHPVRVEFWWRSRRWSPRPCPCRRLAARSLGSGDPTGSRTRPTS